MLKAVWWMQLFVSLCLLCSSIHLSSKDMSNLDPVLCYNVSCLQTSLAPSCLITQNKPQSSSTIIEGCGMVLALPSLQGAMEDVHLGSILPHPLAPFNAQSATATKKHEPAAPSQHTNVDISKGLFIWSLGTCGLYSKFLWDSYRFILLLLPLHTSYTH